MTYLCYVSETIIDGMPMLLLSGPTSTSLEGHRTSIR